MTSDIKLVTDSEFTEKELACDYLLPPPEVSKSEAIIAKKDLKAYSDNSIKEYTPNAVHNFVIHPLQDSLVSLDSLKLNIVAVCKGNAAGAMEDKYAKMLLGDFTLMNHISQITLKIGGADVQTISNPCVIKNMSKLFKYGTIRTQNRELTINGLYPRDQINNPLDTTSSTNVTTINNISYFKGAAAGGGGVAAKPREFIISEIIPLSDIFQVDFSLYPFIYNRKIEVSITWNSERNVDINTLIDNEYVTITGFRQYYLMYEASILNQDSKNQMIKAYQKKVSALIPNTNYILTSLGNYNANSQMQQTISIPIGFSSESITLFFPNSTTASETYCKTEEGADVKKLNTIHHTCNSFRFMNLQKVVVSCGTNVLKTYDFTESSVPKNNASILLQRLTNLTADDGKIRNYSIAYDEYLKCECPKVSYPEFLADYFCLYIDTRPFSQIASNNTLQIDITFGDTDDNVAADDGASNQRILGNPAVLKQLGVVTKNTKVLSFDSEGSCSVFNVANNILNDYLEL